MEHIDFEAITIRKELTDRGGVLEINLTTLGFKGHMLAYQNYLGGGVLGKVAADCNIPDWRNNGEVYSIAEQLKEYFFNLTNPEEGFEHQAYVVNQHLPVSGY